MFRVARLSVRLSCAFVAVMGVFSTASHAAEVPFAGYTNGAFNNPAPPNTSATQTASLFGLTFVNSTFADTTAGGFLGLGSAPIAPATQNTQNLGAMQLVSGNDTYTGNTFSLRVSFTAPTGILPNSSSIFSATLVGSVTSTGNGGVMIDFDNTPLAYTFNDGVNFGSFNFGVNDVAINPGNLVPLTGQITAASQDVPEPAAAGIVGVIAASLLRRRRA